VDIRLRTARAVIVLVLPLLAHGQTNPTAARRRLAQRVQTKKERKEERKKERKKERAAASNQMKEASFLTTRTTTHNEEKRTQANTPSQ